MKKFFRGLAISLLVGALYLSIFNLLVAFPLAHYATDKEAVKGWLVDAGVYEAVPELLSAQLIQPDATGVDQSEQIKEAVSASVTPAFVQESIESVINGTYDFLDGEEEEIEFSIDTKDVVASLESSFLKLTLERLENLPVCESDVQAAEQPNPLEAECRPPSVSVAELKRQAKAEFEARGDSSIPETITPSTLFAQRGSSDDEAATDVNRADLQNVKAAYQFLKVLPYWLMGGVLLFGVLLFAVYRRLQPWLSRVGGVMVSAGVTALLSTLLWHLGSGFIARQAALRTAGASKVGFETVERLVGASAADIAILTYVLAGITLTSGIAIKIILGLKRRRQLEAKLDRENSDPAQTPPETPPQP